MQQAIHFVPRFMTRKEAFAITGNLSKPSKMPGHGYSIPASKCITGAKLRDVCNSVCSKCYALKGRYVFPNVQNALERRLDAFQSPNFVSAMVTIITDLKEEHFRWFDSGDLQSLFMLVQIATIAKSTPKCMHWLPTREYKFVDEYIKLFGAFPDNLIVRVSAHIMDNDAPSRFTHTSQVHTSTTPANVYRCPAPEQGNKCNTCRACWDPNVKTVSYRAH